MILRALTFIGVGGVDSGIISIDFEMQALMVLARAGVLAVAGKEAYYGC